MNIVIVGHVDHGKSTLIGRLLFDTNSVPDSVLEEAKRSSKRPDGSIEFAYLLDSLEEERAKNITIDTSRTFFKTAKRNYIIIDAPGHKEFLKNMVTGASRAEAAILIIDVTRGVEEQTKRHAFVLKLLGINRIVVAANKLDLVEYSEEKFNKTVDEISAFFSSIELSPAAVIPIAAMNGDNLATHSSRMPWYQGPYLLEVLDGFEEKDDLTTHPARFVTQCTISKDGKEVVLGRVESGVLRAGQTLTSYPKKEKVALETIKIMDKDLKEACAGQSVGIVLANKAVTGRSDILCDDASPIVTKSFKSSIFCLAPQGISANRTFTLKCATQAVPCKIKSISQKLDSSNLASTGKNSASLDETEVGEVVIETEEPVVVEDFSRTPALGRFVLQDNDHITAAGIIRAAGL